MSMLKCMCLNDTALEKGIVMYMRKWSVMNASNCDKRNARHSIRHYDLLKILFHAFVDEDKTHLLYHY